MGVHYLSVGQYFVKFYLDVICLLYFCLMLHCSISIVDVVWPSHVSYKYVWVYISNTRTEPVWWWKLSTALHQPMFIHNRSAWKPVDGFKVVFLSVIVGYIYIFIFTAQSHQCFLQNKSIIFEWKVKIFMLIIPNSNDKAEFVFLKWSLLNIVIKI